ncbi:hemagglutinin repeat-containing protein, partial [Microbacterium sp. B19]|uniref:hemagglutinin repeat-containing protein n=1 Tax=Microbacterium sp. B19 TaxID=96765 RepID=UPI0016513E8F
MRWDANNVLSQGQSNETGSVVSGAGNVSLSAGQDINARAAQIQAGNTSVLSVSAGNDINVVAGQSTPD